MRFTFRRRIITAIGAAAAITATSATVLAPAATARPSYYDPELTPCGYLFRTPLDPPRHGTSVYWSPFGTAGIVCYDNGTGLADYYQRDPSGAWHDMNELARGQFFYSVFATGIPNGAHWR
ncbi:hypothetical protein [Nocardia sp. NBC_00416]|uniref:hypothetical protein n=1 Tax=Nocardia sp. NBC_00416 TaxID=2975991 RepID=UPI002E1E0FF1